MESVARWQVPWIALVLVLFGLGGVAFYITGVSIPTVFATIVAICFLLVVLRPKVYGYVMTGVGVLSLGLAGVLLVRDWSLLTVAVLAAVGVGGVIRGVHAQQTTDAGETETAETRRQFRE